MTPTDKIINDWRPEIKSFIDRLIKTGFKIETVNTLDYVARFDDASIDDFIINCAGGSMFHDCATIETTHSEMGDDIIAFQLDYNDSPGNIVKQPIYYSRKGGSYNGVASFSAKADLTVSDHHAEWCRTTPLKCNVGDFVGYF